MDIRKSFGVVEDEAENGRWFVLEHGGEVKVAKLGCLAFKKEVMRLQKPHIAILNSSVDSSELLDKITVKAMAKAILVDWKGITLDGLELEHSQENAEMLLRDFPDFREIISALSAERKNFQLDELAEK